MKNFKKILLTGTITVATLLAMSAISNAATVKVTGEVVNVRKSASTSSNVVAQLSENVECEYLGEEGNWYKVKYKNYTGYVSKDYAKLVGETSNNKDNSNTQNNNSNSQTNDDNNKDNNSDKTNDNQSNNVDNNQQQNNNSQANDNSSKEDTVKLTYKKFNSKTIIRILPLIHSSNIAEAKKNEEVLVLAEASGWSYVQTDEISGWVRTDTLGNAKTVTTGGTNQNSGTNTGTTTSTTSTTDEKVGYISVEAVNMRTGAGTTYSVIKSLVLNTKVTILGEKGDWYKVKAGNDTGYVLKELVGSTKKVTSRSLSEPRTAKDDTENEEVKEDVKNTENITTTVTNTVNKTANTADKKTETANKTSSTSTINKNDSADKNTSATITNNNTSSTIKGTDVIAYAKKFLGCKYVYGGDGSNKTFDCSGFTMYVYKHFGVSLPHYTVSQYNSSKGTKITKQSDLKMGDIVFLTDYVTGAPCGHAGIYISDGNFIHADSTVNKVNISNLNGIYKGRFCGALRIIK